MPKRDAAYMDKQRELITRKTLDCLLRNGLAKTSVHDICAHAGVSVGGFYTHFADREEAIFAACVSDLGDPGEEVVASSWTAYTARLTSLPGEIATPRRRKRLRLGLQFAGELAVYKKRLPGIDEALDRYDAWYRDSLRAIHAAGEIEMPLGLERTARLHAQLVYGAIHRLAIDNRCDLKMLFDELVDGLAMIAVLKTRDRIPR